MFSQQVLGSDGIVAAIKNLTAGNARSLGGAKQDATGLENPAESDIECTRALTMNCSKTSAFKRLARFTSRFNHMRFFGGCLVDS